MFKVYIGSDHGGFEAKEEIKKLLEKFDCYFEDLGTNSNESVDYPIYAKRVCQRVAQQKGSVGILICGSGTGMAIAANKFKGIRAALCYDNYSGKMARKDNDANVICLRGREFDHDKYYEILKAFLTTHFSELDRHKKRLDMVRYFENG